MTSMKVLFAFVKLLILVNGDLDSFKACLLPWLKANIWDNTVSVVPEESRQQIPDDALLLESTVYLSKLPLCISTVKDGVDCDMDDAVSRLKPLFVCINEEANGQQLQKEGAAAVLWSGKRGRAKAESTHTEGKFTFGTLFGKGKTPGIYPDTSVNVLKDYLSLAGYAGKAADIYASSQEPPQPTGYERMLIDMSCIWLLFNSNPKSHGNALHAWTSLAGYEERRGKKNRGRLALSHAVNEDGTPGIKQALVINNYFWNVELPAIARLYSFIYSDTATPGALKVHLTTYDVDTGTDTITPVGWAEHDIFSVIGDLTRIKVVFHNHKDHVQYPIYKGEDTDPKTADLWDLVEIFNQRRASALRIEGRLHHNFDHLLDFIKWTREIPFKTFDATGHIRGGWVTSDDSVTPGDIPAEGDLARSAPLNIFKRRNIQHKKMSSGTVNAYSGYDRWNQYDDVSESGSSLLIGGVAGASAVVIIMLIFCLGLAFGMIIYWGCSQKRALDVQRKKGEMRNWIDDDEDRNEV
eukprot:97165_1